MPKYEYTARYLTVRMLFKRSYPHLLLLAIFMPIFTKAQDIDSLMRVEADTFISNLPEGLQQKQKSAIKSAINGNTAALRRVRNSRNAEAELSTGVKATYLNHSMRLY